MIETRQLFASRNDDETLITGRSSFLPRVRLSYWQLSKEAFNWRSRTPSRSEADVTQEVQKEKPCKSLVQSRRNLTRNEMDDTFLADM